MALEEERLNTAIEPTNRFLDRAKSASDGLREFATTFAQTIGVLAARAAARAEILSEEFVAFTDRMSTPRWARPFVYGFIRMHRAWSPVRRFLSNWLVQPVVDFIKGSLLKLILASNLAGFAVLLGGFLFLNQSGTALIEEKRRSLEVQAEMIAAAIASGARMSSDELIIDAGKLPLPPDTRFPMRDDGFTSHEMSLSPEKLAPILIKMVRATKARARVYNSESILVIDTASLLTRGEVIKPDAEERRATKKPKNFWTRLVEFMIGSEYEVYRELESVHATDYPEVNIALNTGKSQAMMLLTDKGEQTVSAIVLIRRASSTQGIVMLTSREGEISEILSKNRNAIWPLAFVALLASIVTSFFLSRTVADPMRRLSEAAESVSENINANQQLPELSGRTDEVGQMAMAFRAMTAALFRRIEASERFAADVAHELKNPLTAASSTAQSLEFAKTPEQREQLVQQIQGELNRLNRLITDVSSASRLDAELARQSREPVRLDELLENIVSSFGAKVEKFDCQLKLDLRPAEPHMPGNTITSELTISGNLGRLAQVMNNLIDNAISFSGEGSTVTVTAQRRHDWVRVMVEDEGPGIDDDKLETVFDRFYTYRPTAESSRGDNSGLGLNISREIILAHGGRLWAENRSPLTDGAISKPAGARFIVELPVKQKKNKTQTKEPHRDQ